MKRLQTSLLLAALLLSYVSCLASCGQGAADTETESPLALENDTQTVVETETLPHHSVPDTLDFEGADFHVAYPEWQGYKYYFFADEATGDAMNDAIFNRKARVEDYLNVTIMQYSPGYIAEVVTEAKKSITSGDDVYQMVLLHCISGVAEMMTGGYLYNYDDLHYVDYTADWWNRPMMDTLRLGKNTYYGVSDYMIPCPYAVFFNKDMVLENGFDDPYQLVYEGKWTLDRFVEMASAASRDLDGDGKHTKEDVFGMTANEGSKYICLMTGADQFVTGRDENGRVVIDMNTERMYSIVEKLSQLANTSIYYKPPKEEEEFQFPFTEGRMLFRLGAISEASMFREAEATIGILPAPKFDEAQENYVSLDWGGLMGVPASIQNPDLVGAVMELLAFESGKTVIPAYYDVLLAGKLARDTDTVAMLDILFDTIAYEPGVFLSSMSGAISGLLYTASDVILMKKSDFASTYAKEGPGAETALEKFYKDLEKLEAGE